MIELRSLKDFYKNPKNPVSTRIDHPTFELQTLVDGTLKRVEYKEVSTIVSPFDYRDFSLESILASGNTSLLNPVSAIPQSSMDVSDVVDSHAEYLENVQRLNNMNVEFEN